MTTALLPRTGQTRAGLPVSVNVAPAPDLAPYIQRLYVTSIDQPDGQQITDFLLGETAFVRIQPRGAWEVEVEPGCWRRFSVPVLVGAQSRPLNVRVGGSVASLGFAIRPSGWCALFDMPAARLADRIVPLGEVWPQWTAMLAPAGEQVDEPRAAVSLLEAGLRQILAARGDPPANAEMAALERIARQDPTRPVADIAAWLGLSVKQLERRTLGHFGHLPKTVLRRSRFLDLAATMRGVATPADEELAALRYYDQPHLTRETRRFTGMTPAEFLRTPTLLLTPGIEARQRHKAEEAALVPPGAKAPWLA